jgi:hypothetical protein
VRHLSALGSIVTIESADKVFTIGAMSGKKLQKACEKDKALSMKRG